jgi:hypothetical protein
MSPVSNFHTSQDLSCDRATLLFGFFFFNPFSFSTKLNSGGLSDSPVPLFINFDFSKADQRPLMGPLLKN